MAIARDKNGTPLIGVGMNIVRGEVESCTPLHKFGHGPDVGTSRRTMWGINSEYTYPGSAFRMKISSTNSVDTHGATGAHSVKFTFLNSAYELTTETHSLNGHNVVLTTDYAVRMFRAQVIKSGSLGKNVGLIYSGGGTVTDGDPAEKFTFIGCGDGQTLQSFYTVPASFDLMMTDLYGSVAAGKSVELDIWAREFEETMVIKEVHHLYEGALDHAFDPPVKFKAKTDIEIRVRGAASATDTSGGFHGVLVPSDDL